MLMPAEASRTVSFGRRRSTIRIATAQTSGSSSTVTGRTMSVTRHHPRTASPTILVDLLFDPGVTDPDGSGTSPSGAVTLCGARVSVRSWLWRCSRLAIRERSVGPRAVAPTGDSPAAGRPSTSQDAIRGRRHRRRSPHICATASSAGLSGPGRCGTTDPLVRPQTGATTKELMARLGHAGPRRRWSTSTPRSPGTS